ncbi:MAG: hypothetical protein NVS2B9_08960 [Myxococcales bacterium]
MIQAQDRHARTLALALVASAALGLFFWHGWVLWPVKLLVVLMHESGHAAATLLVGGQVQAIRLSPDEGGLTTSLYAQTLLRQIVVSSAGYVGSTISGCVLLWAAARATTGRLPLALLAGWTLLVGILWVRDPFTLAFAGAATVLLGLCARLGPPPLRRFLLAFLAAFSVLYALFDIEDDLLHFQGPGLGLTDADALARVTPLPALAWGVGWGALSLFLVGLTLARIFAGPAQARGRMRSATNSSSEPRRAK